MEGSSSGIEVLSVLLRYYWMGSTRGSRTFESIL
jgi:hypothetical protein